MALGLKEYTKHINMGLNQINQRLNQELNSIQNLEKVVGDTVELLDSRNRVAQLKKQAQNETKFPALAATLGGKYDKEENLFFFEMPKDENDNTQGYYTIDGNVLKQYDNTHNLLNLDEEDQKTIFDSIINPTGPQYGPTGVNQEFRVRENTTTPHTFAHKLNEKDQFHNQSGGFLIETELGMNDLPDDIEANVKGERAMINRVEAAFIRAYGNEAHEWLYDNWQGKSVDHPDLGKIRSYAGTVDIDKGPWTASWGDIDRTYKAGTTQLSGALGGGSGIWGTGQGLFSGLGGKGGFLAGGAGTFLASALPWVGMLTWLGGAEKAASAARKKKKLMRKALDRVPKFQTDIMSKQTELTDTIDRFEEAKSGNMQDLWENVSAQYSDVNKLKESLFKRSGAIHTGSAAEIIEGGIGDIEAKGLASLRQFQDQYFGQYDKFAKAFEALGKERSEVDVKEDEWQTEYSYAQKHKNWYDNLF
jgi:hypothetical protein